MPPANLLAECQKAGVIVELASGALKLKGQSDAVHFAAGMLRPFKDELVQYLDQPIAEPLSQAGQPRQASSTAPSDDTTCARVTLFRGRGLNQAAAMALAQRLTVRDQQHDERRVCLECAHMAGTANARRCGQWRQTRMKGPAMPADLVDVLQRCRGFAIRALRDSEASP
ncbi:hypothetical protein ACPJXG_10905 [Janthinobacterium sp. NFX145]|uniref:hypothetical protein n=1 Tax=Janthinobacterium sp. NFX145 TaxID=3415602 RepID=UPI003CC5AEB1